MFKDWETSPGVFKYDILMVVDYMNIVLSVALVSIALSCQLPLTAYTPNMNESKQNANHIYE